MHHFGKPGEHQPLEHDSGKNDDKEFNNSQCNEGDISLSLVVTAISQLERSRQRSDLFDGRFTTDHGWAILLLIYLYQASGTPISINILIHESRLSAGTAQRYVDAMQQDGLLEPGAMILTKSGRSKLEALLSFYNEKDT